MAVKRFQRSLALLTCAPRNHRASVNNRPKIATKSQIDYHNWEIIRRGFHYHTGNIITFAPSRHLKRQV
jgi:hypothetical protein